MGPRTSAGLRPNAINCPCPCDAGRSCTLGDGGRFAAPLSPTPLARCADTGSLGASTCGCSCAMFSSPFCSFNWSGDNGGSTTEGCGRVGSCSFDLSCETSAVGATTCGANCGTFNCDTGRAEAAIGCAAGTGVQATMLGSATSWFSLTLGG